jgi:hypothetical protein
VLGGGTGIRAIATRWPRPRAGRRLSGARNPENERYDHACDLVKAAAAIRHAMRPEAAAAVPALLGCPNAGLADLRLMTSELLARST